MNFTRLYNKCFCVMQWSIGFCNGNIESLIKEKKSSLSFKWLPGRGHKISVADPFIFRDHTGNVCMLYEDFSMTDTSRYGKILKSTVDKDFNITGDKVILDTKSHSSYPFLFTENDKLYVIPETSKLKKVWAYEFDFEKNELVNGRILIDNLSLLDSTIFKYNNKYWLFATLAGGKKGDSQLNIFYSETLLGNYKAHSKNPVKNNQDGARPAGNVIEVEGNLYRPAQNCKQHYGASLSINKIITLTEDDFVEELYFEMKPDKKSPFNSGIHTINFLDNIIVVDGIKMLFRPWIKWRLFLNKKLKYVGSN